MADGITNAVAPDAVGKDAQKFWSSVGEAAKKLGRRAGRRGAGGGASQAAGAAANAAPAGRTVPAGIVFLLALGQVIVGLAVWIELLLRSAAIYVAVLFMPAALGRRSGRRCGRGVASGARLVCVHCDEADRRYGPRVGGVVGRAAVGYARNGVGVLLAAVVIFALAAWAPWGLMHLVSIDHE